MAKFVNKNKVTYKVSDVLNSIKSDKKFNDKIDGSIYYYNDKLISTQFWSMKFNNDNFEIISINNTKGIKSGFYIVDKIYGKFQSSSFIKKALRKSIMRGSKTIINKDKKIDKYFIEYITNNTIIYFDYDSFINEFKNTKVSKIPSNNKNYNPHFKSPHSVNGHWRNQPYGPRNNPKYKKIWIKEFDKGVS